MTPHKRRKLYLKRTPWRKHRYSLYARLAQRAMRVAAVAQGMSRVRVIRACNAPRAEKDAAMAEAVRATWAAVAKIPLPGAKTP